MRNKCKHNGKTKLVSSGYSLGIRWYWCTDCGSTRMDKLECYDKWYPEKSTWENGKWKSPRIALKDK